MKTLDLIDALKTQLCAVSDYDLSRKMGWSRQRVSNYRKLTSSMDDETAVEVSSILGLCSGQVLAWMHAERADCPAVRDAWRDVADRLDQPSADIQNYPVLFRAAILKMLKDQPVTHNLHVNVDAAHNHELSPWQKTWTRMIFRLATHRPKVDAHTLRSLRF